VLGAAEKQIELLNKAEEGLADDAAPASPMPEENES
jgi:hypothetical protein